MCRLQTNVNEGVTRILDNGAVLKNRFILNYFMLVASSVPDKFTKIALLVWNFMQSFKLYYKNNNFFLSVIANHSKSDIFIVNWVAGSQEIR